jgi:2-keto-4-pentenoate hydratase/2-oxohepta-3-ene-1,7-dioic acid hydratase in catechol pathway
MFTKPANAVVGPYDDVPVHPCAQGELDYEAELCVIIGKDAKDVSEENALDYVHGYTAGNDISARKYQLPEWSGNQYCFAKSFDGFAPVGPYIATAEAIPDPQVLDFRLKLNNSVRQQSSTSDMIFSVRKIIAHVTQGTTLKKGTIIMTGTPAGVAYFMTPKGSGFIKHGDTVEISFDEIGSMRNKFVFL